MAEEFSKWSAAYHLNLKPPLNRNFRRFCCSSPRLGRFFEGIWLRGLGVKNPVQQATDNPIKRGNTMPKPDGHRFGPGTESCLGF